MIDRVRPIRGGGDDVGPRVNGEQPHLGDVGYAFACWHKGMKGDQNALNEEAELLKGCWQDLFHIYI